MGAAIAKDWASLGAEVCVADINEEGIAAVAEEIRAAGGSATHISLDVTSEEQAKAAVAHVVARQVRWPVRRMRSHTVPPVDGGYRIQ